MEKVNNSLRVPYIGYILSDFSEIGNPKEMRKHESTLVLYPEYEEGLYRIEENEFIDVLFHFDKSEDFELKTITLSGQRKGVFSSRSPKRPSGIGLTTVKLLGRKGNTLRVHGLDAINKTPLLDIKCGDSYYLQEELNRIHEGVRKTSPRIELWSHIIGDQQDQLLIKAAQMHGHYCPGLALGVMAAAHLMKIMRNDSDGMEDLLAFVETNNCFSDGVQFVTACTFGNNALIFKDLGKLAFSLLDRKGKGYRISAKKGSREYMKEMMPDFEKVYEETVKNQDHSEPNIGLYKKEGVKKAFATLQMDFDKLFEVQELVSEIPEYAPSHDSLLCSVCGEECMSTRTLERKGRIYCLDCAGVNYDILDGHGMHKGRLNVVNKK
jgi:tRNA-Thr(GGU) m(6)t(6)A37 methyltransferase TsaA